MLIYIPAFSKADKNQRDFHKETVTQKNLCNSFFIYMRKKVSKSLVKHRKI